MKPSTTIIDYLKYKVPDFVEEIERAKEHGGSVTITLDRFEDNSILLYNSLWYASSMGILMVITPKQTPIV